MKVIDLLNKIANGEIDRNNKYHFSSIDYCTINEFFNRYILDEENLNLEIIEIPEEKKIPEEIECYHQYDECVVKNKFYQDKTGSLVDEIIIDKINEIIDYLDYLKSKGE